MAEDKVVVTNPDPTLAVKEALELAIKNLDEKIAERFKGIDQATVLARNELKDQLGALEASINDKFVANEKLVDQLGRANSTALTAALQTQEKSAAKTETSIGDMIKQMKTAFDDSNKATNEKIDRLTSRLDLGEGRVGGAAGSRQSSDSTRTFIVAMIGSVLIATGIIVSVMLRK